MARAQCSGMLNSSFSPTPKANTKGFFSNTYWENLGQDSGGKSHQSVDGPLYLHPHWVFTQHFVQWASSSLSIIIQAPALVPTLVSDRGFLPPLSQDCLYSPVSPVLEVGDCPVSLYHLQNLRIVVDFNLFHFSLLGQSSNFQAFYMWNWKPEVGFLHFLPQPKSCNIYTPTLCSFIFSYSPSIWCQCDPRKIWNHCPHLCLVIPCHFLPSPSCLFIFMCCFIICWFYFFFPPF